MTRTERDRLADLIERLVRFDSSNPPGKEAECARYVRDWFEQRGVDAELVSDPDPDRPQVAATVGSGDPTVVLNGHLDVVPVDDPGRWEYPPFEGTRAGGRIYGRGSADMRAGLAIAMLTMAEFDDALEPGDGTLVFHGAMGEETGDPGTRTLLEHGYDGDYGIVLEPTDFRVATRAKGLVAYEITVSGTPSHASRPDQGDSAIDLARPLLDAIDDYDERLRERTDPLVGRAYANVTRFAAGVDGNLGVLPGRASLVLDRRVLPEEDVDDVESEVIDLLAAVESEHGVDLAFEEVQRYEAAAIETDCVLAETVRRRTREVEGEVEAPWGIEAATDVRNLVNDAGMEAVTWGPGRLAAAHTRDESISLDAARRGREILAEAVSDLLDREESDGRRRDAPDTDYDPT